MTRVIHIRDAPPTWRSNPKWVYIGRPGPWGNPIIRGQKCLVCKGVHRDAGSTLPCLHKWLKEDPRAIWMRGNIESLRGKVLVCFCKPNPCHGDILIEFLEVELEEEK